MPEPQRPLNLGLHPESPVAEAGRQYLESVFAAHLIAVEGNEYSAPAPQRLVSTAPATLVVGDSQATAAAAAVERGLFQRQSGLAGLHSHTSRLLHAVADARRDAQKEWDGLAGEVRKWWGSIPTRRERWAPPQSELFLAQTTDFGERSNRAREYAEQRMKRIADGVPIEEVETFMPDGHRFPPLPFDAAAAAELRRVLQLRNRLPSIRDDGRIPGGADAVLDAAYTNPDGTLRLSTGVMIGDAADGRVPTTWYTPHAVAGRLPTLHRDNNVNALMLTGLAPEHTSELQSLAAAGDTHELRQFLMRHYRIPFQALYNRRLTAPDDVYFEGLARLVDTAHSEGIQVGAIGDASLGSSAVASANNARQFLSTAPAGSNYLIFTEMHSTALPHDNLENLNTSLGIDTTIDAFHPNVHTATSFNSPYSDGRPIGIRPDEAVLNRFKGLEPSTAIWNTYPTMH